MTRSQFRVRSWVAILTATLAPAALAAVAGLRGTDNNAYNVTKDLAPLIVAVAAALLAQSYQRRSSFIEALRTYWPNACMAVNCALKFIESGSLDPDRRHEISVRLWASIDELRSLYRLVEGGYYPFEPLKNIANCIVSLDLHTEPEKLRYLWELMFEEWRLARDGLLTEFDRPLPGSSVVAHRDLLAEI